MRPGAIYFEIGFSPVVDGGCIAAVIFGGYVIEHFKVHSTTIALAPGSDGLKSGDVS